MNGSRNILLISPFENDFRKQFESYPSGALILLGTMAANKGHNVKVVHMAADGVDIPALKEVVRSFKPDIAGVTMNTFQTRCAKEVCGAVKEIDRNILVVAGGPHPSALRSGIFKDYPDMDIAVIGEGEHTFMDIVEGKDPKTIKGVCLKGFEAEPREPVQDLEYLPLPNLGLVNISNFSGADPVGAFPSMYIMASRGCPFQCTFCNKSIWGSKVRHRKPELITAEARWLNEKYGIREIFFQDDTFNINREWAESVLKLIIKEKLNKKLVFKTSFRANKSLVDESLLRLAKEAGFWMIFFGVESGNQRMLDSMKKGLTVEEIKRAFALTEKAGIKTLAPFIIGLPGETKETYADTIKIWKEINPYVTGCSAAMPFPRTEFDSIVTAKGHKTVFNYDEYSMNKVMIRTDALSTKEIEGLCLDFKRRVIRKFFTDLLLGRYIKMMFFALRSPWYMTHMFVRIKTYLGF